jgi:hypothetical protein
MATVFERHQAGPTNSLRNVLGSKGEEVVIACDDERRDLQRLELGMQIVAVLRGPRLIHQPVFDGSRFQNSVSPLFDEPSLNS